VKGGPGRRAGPDRKECLPGASALVGSKTVLRAKNNNGAFRLPKFRTGKNATAVKTVFYLQLNRQRDQ